MSDLAGIRVLIVEDEPLVAMMLEDILIDLGCVVVGPASRLTEALDLVRQVDFEAAILDVNLHGERSFPVAEALHKRGTRYVFATGYGAQGVDNRFSHVPIMQKPYRQAQIAAALSTVLSSN